MTETPSRSTSKERKNRSMLSTNHMSCNCSHLSNFYPDRKKSANNKSAILSYTDVPLQKATPRWNQSASTWRHSSHRYSFSKDNRFKNQKLQYTDILQPELPTTRSSKACSFGKGRRRPISEVVLRNAKEKPAPDRYSLKNYDESTRKKSKGKSFGLDWKAYEKTYLQHRKDVYACFQVQDNPAAKYEVRQSPGKQSRKFSMYGRLKMYTEKLSESKNWVPGARYLIKDRHLDNEQGMHERSFGIGERVKLDKPANEYPGAKYIIPGFCDKFQQTQKKAVGLSDQSFRIRT